MSSNGLRQQAYTLFKVVRIHSSQHMDNKDKDCRACRKGVYIETSLNDDWSGVLHCSVCKHRVQRYTNEMELIIDGKKYWFDFDR